MEFLLFDERAVYSYVTANSVQNTHGESGKQLVQYIRGTRKPQENGDIFEATVVLPKKNGLIFSGMNINNKEKCRVYCIDLTTCSILSESDANLLIVLQKSLRTALKIWHKQPFSVSERVSHTKSILFPFTYPDMRRLVIEREPNISNKIKNLVDFPLLAYKYGDEDAPLTEEIADTSVFTEAVKSFAEEYDNLQKSLKKPSEESVFLSSRPFQEIKHIQKVGRGDFSFKSFDEQESLLTDAQKKVVHSAQMDTPLRVEGAAGTGKTCSLVMRAYWLLERKRQDDIPFRAIFITHSISTHKRVKEMFERYPNAELYLGSNCPQSIRFVTLIDFCMEIADFSANQLPDRDAGETKFYQKMLIDHVVDNYYNEKKIKTYYPNLSWELQEVFNKNCTSRNALIAMLQHEFSVQIKGRTNGTITSYRDIPSISNGLPCRTEKDKDLVFDLYQDYQTALSSVGEYDVDDVTMEALSRLNAPKWRRERLQKGFDYIIIDEMHLFNINEKSVFHYLTKNIANSRLPFCFALDYGQAIGDRGFLDYAAEKKEFPTETDNIYDMVFRNSPLILNFCASIAASGIIMFRNDYKNPYNHVKSVLSDDEIAKSEKPTLYMYQNEEKMLQSLKSHIKRLKRELHCKESDIAVVSFDERYSGQEGPYCLEKFSGKKFIRLSVWNSDSYDSCPLASPYDINGMEFQAVILLGVDEGRLPQTTGTSDISKHYIFFSAYNLLYLTASRAIYRLLILGNKQNKTSSCLLHSLENDYLKLSEENTP